MPSLIPTNDAVVSIAQDYQTFVQHAASIRRRAVNLQAGLSSNQFRRTVADHYRSVLDSYNDMNRIRQRPGIPAYVQAQIDDATWNGAEAWTTFSTAMTALLTQIRTAFPTATAGGKNYLLTDYFSGADVVSDIFTPAQLSSLQPLLQAVIDSIQAPAA